MNTGAYPIDPTTPVGLFRFEIGDVVGTANEAGDSADYEFMSDATITALLAAYPDTDLAKSKALRSMSTQLIAAAQDIQVADIRLKTVERANLMLQAADGFAMNATVGDAALGFSVVPLVTTPTYSVGF